MLRILRAALVALVVVAAANVVFLVARGSYDFYVGALHLYAHGFFKPLLILNGAFVLCVLLRSPVGDAAFAFRPPKAAMMALAALGFSFTVNPLYDEWNYRGLSANLKSVGDLTHLFSTPQFDAWYRPLGFLSLWIDSRVFGEHLWGYHVQNVALHLVNAVLAYRIAKRMGVTAAAAQWAGLLFAVAAVTYEPVMWPSARFDLLAMMFAGLALVAAMDFLAGRGAGWLWVSLACYLLGLLSKESAYAFPVLLAVVAWRAPRKGRLPLAGGVVTVTAVMLAIRFAVLGGVGGYAGQPHLSFTATTVQSLFTKVIPISLLAINMNYPMPPIMLATVGAFAVLLAASAVAGASTTPSQRIFALCALAGAAPVATIVSWLDFSAQQVRYVYMPAMFVMMLAAVALSNARWPAILLSAFAALSLLCGVYNTWVYRTTYQRADELASHIASDYTRWRGAPGVKIAGMTGDFNGVLFSKFQLQYRLRELLPGVPVDFSACGDGLCYQWEAEGRTLVRR